MRSHRSSSTGSVLLQAMDHAFDVPSWHGPNLGSVLRGVDAKLAAKRVPGRKCIWEQALHAAYWKQRVLNKVAGTSPFPGRGSNWPKMPDRPTASAWKQDLAMLRGVHARLRGAVAGMDASRLDDAKLRRMILGAALHDIYHAGQIRLLRKLLSHASK